MSEFTARKTLAHILEGNTDVITDQFDDNLSDVEVEEDEFLNNSNPNFCIECKDMPREIHCIDCDENFCKACFNLIHRNGKRKDHKSEHVGNDLILNDDNGNNVKKIGSTSNDDDIGTSNPNSNGNNNNNIDGTASFVNNDAGMDLDPVSIVPGSANETIERTIMNGIKRQIKYIPLRLTPEERQLLRLLEAALNVSEYTDRVDIFSYKSKAKRIVEQLKEICSILAGLVVASNLKIGQELIENKNFEDNSDWYQSVFEIGRRYKIMNPEKMRDTFGKLMYMVMDSRLPEIKNHMEFDLYKPIKTVYSYLNSKEDKKSLNMFDDILIVNATAEISPQGKSRNQINREIKLKESAIETISNRYSSSNGFSKEEIKQVLYSIGDFNAYTNSNRKPILRMLTKLEKFPAESVKSGKSYNLGIMFGIKGSRLTHDHSKQYHYVHQSLQLWSLIMREMIHLWYLADDDLLSESKYSLQSTGQGLNRVKASPQVLRYMHKILSECQQNCKTWIGSSVIHLGDYTVPNSLFFLDKYIQVPRILIPVDLSISKIEELAQDKFIKKYIEDQFGSTQDLEKIILQDFFSYGFDGSGTNDFYSSGSCIDGRLTSAWNWANEVSKKPYYKFFLLSGFIGFNGSDGF
ncbi:hypothetical protein PACTADRAFT_49430 [Pachysolen tannophilus NRRL Y-2460]|uniref:Non-canonical E2 ubiquitin-conjugating enzyme C-terminal domain-containing protein n=1 Tax=Pachysolen tannophilus NRRL Y-2460 TaxID=669874 RepID=A0A1E4TWG6_PACTA|nr:hypothetical protein PACTADRAFT_49430 [Pachysolen tannophilus NRRL Y-2460]